MALKPVFFSFTWYSINAGPTVEISKQCCGSGSLMEIQIQDIVKPGSGIRVGKKSDPEKTSWIRNTASKIKNIRIEIRHFLKNILYTQLFLQSAFSFLTKDPDSNQNQNKQQVRYLRMGFTYISTYAWSKITIVR